MAWSIGPSWLKPGSRRTLPPPSPPGHVSAELRATAAALRHRIVDTAPVRSPAAALGRSLDQLDHDLSRRPRVALLGEFNAGKTTLTNLLARSRGLPTDVLANTRVPTLVHHVDAAPEPILVAERARGDARADSPQNGKIISAKSPFEYELLPSRAALLRECTLLDTPGLSDPTHAEEIADLYARIADIAIWCSIAGHCWRESERQAWDRLSPRLRRFGVLVLTGAEAVPRPGDRERIRQRLQREAAGRFGSVIFLAARDASRALDVDTGEVRDRVVWADSGAAEIESVIATLVAHVADQRALRSRRWAARLLRHVSTLPHADLGPTWWLPPLIRLSDDVRQTAMSLRAHRIDRVSALMTVEAAVVQLRSDLVAKLDLLGRTADAHAVEVTVDENLERLAALTQPLAHHAVVDGIAHVGTRVFNDVSKLMRDAERETATLAQLEARLLELTGSKKSEGRKASTR